MSTEAALAVAAAAPAVPSPATPTETPFELLVK